jgi:hypothetical protein
MLSSKEKIENYEVFKIIPHIIKCKHKKDKICGKCWSKTKGCEYWDSVYNSQKTTKEYLDNIKKSRPKPFIEKGIKK